MQDLPPPESFGDHVRDWWAGLAIIGALVVGGILRKLGVFFVPRKEWDDKNHALEVRMKALENSRVESEQKFRDLAASLDRLASQLSTVVEHGSRPMGELRRTLEEIHATLAVHKTHLEYLVERRSDQERKGRYESR